MGAEQSSQEADDASIEAEYEELCRGYDEKTGAPQLFAKDAIKLQTEGKLFVIDTRTAAEHEVSRLPGAKLLIPSAVSMAGALALGSPLAFVGDGSEHGQALENEAKAAAAEGKTVVCACTAGLRSGFAATTLSSRLGCCVLSLHGGIISFDRAGGRLEDGSGDADKKAGEGGHTVGGESDGGIGIGAAAAAAAAAGAGASATIGGGASSASSFAPQKQLPKVHTYGSNWAKYVKRAEDGSDRAVF